MLRTASDFYDWDDKNEESVFALIKGIKQYPVGYFQGASHES
jgi:hypothetical protein